MAGAGSAKPVVSMIKSSNLSRFSIRFPMMRIRSPRTVQPNAAVVHFDNLLVSINDKLSVDSHLAEFVYNNGNFFPVLRRQDVIEEGRFTRSQVARNYCDRNSFYSV